MAFYEARSIRYFSFEIFDSSICQGIFTRQGGVSPAPWHSLNTGGLSGDTRENVVENRRRIFLTIERSVESIYDVWQVHSQIVVSTDRPRPLNQSHQKADAIVTDHPEVTLFMRFGDCVPIFIHDPVRKVVAIAHAGWQGTVLKIASEAVKMMVQRYHCEPVNLLAGIGPSICVNHYEVGADVINRVKDALGVDASEVLTNGVNQANLDLWKANQILLRRAGLLEEHIQISGICTAENTQDWYSHRAELGKTGRFGALLALK